MVAVLTRKGTTTMMKLEKVLTKIRPKQYSPYLSDVVDGVRRTQVRLATEFDSYATYVFPCPDIQDMAPHSVNDLQFWAHGIVWDEPLQKVVECTLEANTATLLRALTTTYRAISTDSSRDNICHLAFINGDVVATNGHWLAKAHYPFAYNFKAKTVLWPHRFVDMIITALKLKGSQAAFSADGQSIVIKVGQESLHLTMVSDCTYPDYAAVLPDKHKLQFMTSKRDLQAAMKRLKRKGLESLALELNRTKKQMTLTDSVVEYDTTRVECVPVALFDDEASTGPAGINPTYLGRLLQSVPEDSMSWCLPSVIDPIQITSGDTEYFIMPMRL